MTRQCSVSRTVSGGQIGADQAALRAARATGVDTAGWAAQGWITEDGPAGWLAELGVASRNGI
jgi:Circularly permutated YpsA SLOG family